MYTDESGYPPCHEPLCLVWLLGEVEHHVEELFPGLGVRLTHKGSQQHWNQFLQGGRGEGRRQVMGKARRINAKINQITKKNVSE